MIGKRRSPAVISNAARIKCKITLLKKAFKSIIEMDNLYPVVVENVAAETNDFFFQAFALLLVVFNVFNIE